MVRRRIQQNRYCGIILKNSIHKTSIPDQFIEKESLIYLKSDFQDAFDGVDTADVSAYSRAEFKENTLVLISDQVGIRRIYYVDHRDFFAFANTIAELKKIPFITFACDPLGALSFFLYGKTETLYENVNTLAAGSTLTYRLSSHSFSIGARPSLQMSDFKISEEDAIHKTRTLTLASANTILTNAEGRIGSFLSGGIDSSAIAAASTLLDANVPALTALTGKSKFDELHFAEEVINHLAIKEWHQILVREVEKSIIDLHKAMELPTTSLGTMLQYELFRFCKHHGIQHILDGTGADALFAGHNYYHPIYWNGLLRERKWKTFRNEIRHFEFEAHWLKYYVRNVMLYYYVPRFRTGSKIKIFLNKNPLLKALNPDLIYDNLEAFDKPETPDLKNLNRFLAHEFFGGPVTELLRFTDRIGKHFDVMAHPIFAQSDQLFEFALQTPAQFKIKKGYTKSILRNAFSDVLPKKILSRKDKMGLVAPNNLWMKENKDFFLSFLNDGLEDFFQVSKLREELSRTIDSATEVENYKVFRFISFSIWYQNWIR